MVSEQGRDQDGSREEERDSTKAEQPSDLIHIVLNVSYHSKPKKALCGAIVIVQKPSLFQFSANTPPRQYGSNWSTTNFTTHLKSVLDGKVDVAGNVKKSWSDIKKNFTLDQTNRQRMQVLAELMNCDMSQLLGFNKPSEEIVKVPVVGTIRDGKIEMKETSP